MQLDVLRRFALFEVGLDQLRRTLSCVFECHLELQPVGSSLQRRSASGRFRLPEPGIVITREHIQNALDRRRFELISERELAEWATILLMNDAYVSIRPTKTSSPSGSTTSAFTSMRARFSTHTDRAPERYNP